MKVNDKGVFIDGIDKKILRALMQDARTPILEIARGVGISGAAIHQRLRKLEKSGLLAGSKFIVNPKILGYTTMAFVGVYLDKAVSNPEAVKQLKRIPEVIECHYTTGLKLSFLYNNRLIDKLRYNQQKRLWNQSL